MNKNELMVDHFIVLSAVPDVQLTFALFFGLVDLLGSGNFNSIVHNRRLSQAKYNHHSHMAFL